MRIDVKLNGMEEINSAVENANLCMRELMEAVGQIDRCLRSLGLEIIQPPEQANAKAWSALQQKHEENGMNQTGFSGPKGPIGEPGPLAAETDMDLLPHIINELERAVKGGKYIRTEDGCNHQRLVDGWALIQALDVLKNYEALLKQPLHESIPHAFYHVSRPKKTIEGVV